MDQARAQQFSKKALGAEPVSDARKYTAPKDDTRSHDVGLAEDIVEEPTAAGVQMAAGVQTSDGIQTAAGVQTAVGVKSRRMSYGRREDEPGSNKSLRAPDKMPMHWSASGTTTSGVTLLRLR